MNQNKIIEKILLSDHFNRKDITKKIFKDKSIYFYNFYKNLTFQLKPKFIPMNFIISNIWDEFLFLILKIKNGEK